MARELREVVFVDGVRTPFGKAGGVYCETRADDLVVKCLTELLRRNPSLSPDRVDEVAIAATTQIGDQGLTIGRTAALLAGLPRSVPGFAIDRMCAGAMTAVTTTASGIAFGAYDVALAGGVEHMGRHPMGEGVDPNPRILAERIVDPSALVMGETAENLHDRFPSITRERADAFAAASQRRTADAYTAGRIQRGLVGVAARTADAGWGYVTRDEPMRPQTSIADLAGLRTPFRSHGRVTAGNSAGLTDGATACLLAAEGVAAELGLPVRMRLVSYAFAGVDPELMGVGPIPSTERALASAGLSIGDIGLIELNEAFAVQVLAFLDHFGIPDDDPRVNPCGGAIAVGHPLAASGVRLMMQLADEFAEHPEVRYGISAMCIGIGMGGTVIWENPAWSGALADPSAAISDPSAAISDPSAAISDPSATNPSAAISDPSAAISDPSAAISDPSAAISDPSATKADPSAVEGLADMAARSEGELVTRALSRDVELPHGAGTMALITLDNGRDHTKPNTFGARGLAELNRAIDDALARPDVRAIGITGKPFVLAAGADLTGLPHIRSRDDALAVARVGHAVMRKLGEGGKPTFCFVNGAALGGGLELALHCDYRTVLDSVRAIATPEVLLGLVPGWGGAFLMPNLIGAERALTVIVDNPLEQNRMLTGGRAFELGLADAVFGGPDFFERSIAWAAAVVRGEIAVNRAEPDRGDAWDAAVAAARQRVDARLHGAAPAAYRALDLVAAAKDGDRDPAFNAEDEALADLIVSPQLKAGLYAFDLVQRRARHPVGAPNRSLARDVGKVGVVGAGLMASQLATLLARRLKVPVVMTDLNDELVQYGVAAVRAEFDKLCDRGRISADEANRLRALVSGSTDADVFADADLVIEAVFEDLDAKRQALASVERVVRPEAVLASNTSSLSVTAMAESLQHPERLVGLHFFNPVAVLPLVEVVRTAQTDEAALATAFSITSRLHKSAVLVSDAPAFVVNRLLTRFLAEAMRALDDGTKPSVADHALDPLGLPMSPFALLQLVGPPIALHVLETLHASFGERFPLSRGLRALVSAGKTGIWSWDPAGHPCLDDETAALLSGGEHPWTGEQLRERAIAAMADEAARMLDEGVVAEAADIDLCMILGAGWPFHLGGITPFLDATGVSERITGGTLARRRQP